METNKIRKVQSQTSGRTTDNVRREK